MVCRSCLRPISPALLKLTAHKIYKSGIVSLEYDLN